MTGEPLRVALFACAYNEIDGVANTCRRFEEFAIQRNLPFLSIHGGTGEYEERTGSALRCEFRRRSPKFNLDANHDFDLNFWRYRRHIEKVVREFNPNIVHITGPSDVGQMGAFIAHRLRVPLLASWHTNVHEYAERRFVSSARVLPDGVRRKIGEHVREMSFQLTARFYRIARVLFAPNHELVRRLESATGKPCHIMSRGVDANLFRPERRDSNEEPFTIGYVGRFTPEKNVRFLAELERALIARGQRDFRLLLVGQGAEEHWLRSNLKNAEFTGVLQGESLARAYANMDLFVFPSRTDTFGNVVLEALASGVPAVVTDEGGPKFIVRHGEDGLIAKSDSEFVEGVSALISNRQRLAQMRITARNHALQASWEAVFEHVYRVYEDTLQEHQTVVRWRPGLVQI